MLKNSFQKPKLGVFYLVPNPKTNKYTIYSDFDDIGNETVHLMLWDSIVNLLRMRFKNKSVDLIEDSYRGLPRGRVMEKGDKWLVAWGKDFPEEYKSDILSEFQLNDANSLGKVEWEFQKHETMYENEKKIVEKTLGIKITPEGFKLETKKKSSEDIIKQILKESSIDYRETEESKQFLSKYNISSEDLDYLGSGDFGTAYSIGNNKVLKITSSKSEFELAKEIMEGKFTNFVKIFEVKKINSDYYIVMEKLKEDSNIESLWYEMLELLQTQSLPVQYIGNFDEEEYENEYGKINKELKKFMDELYNVVLDYRKLGIEMSSDIHPENLGRALDGTLKAFDIDNKRH